MAIGWLRCLCLPYGVDQEGPTLPFPDRCAHPATGVVAFDGVHLASVGLFLDIFDLVSRRVAEQFRSRDDIGMETRIRLLGKGSGAVRVAGGRMLELDDGLVDDRSPLLIHVPDFEWPDRDMAEALICR